MKTKVISSNPVIPPVVTGKIWHSPLNVYWHIQQETKKLGEKAIESNTPFYNRVREARIGAVLCLAMFAKMGKPTYLQLHTPDPPDLVVMQPSKENIGTRDITQVEITTYIGKPKVSLLKQLKKRKIPPGIPVLSENYILLVNVGIGLQVNPNLIMNYLKINQNVFPVWLLQEKVARPDTIAKLTMIYPEEVYEIEVNIGKAANDFQKLGYFDIVHSRRTGSIKFVRAEPGGKFYDAPWETIGK